MLGRVIGKGTRMSGTEAERYRNETAVGAGVWNALTDEARRQELSHWRGIGKWADDTKWLGVGARSFKIIGRILRDQKVHRNFWSEKKTILEWGPGGGSNAFAFRDVAENYYGVDIAEKNLAEAARVVNEGGAGPFRPILLADAPQSVPARLGAPVDLFLSTAVFQHFPSKEYGVEVLKAIADASRPGAFGFIQIRYDDGSKRFRANASVGDYSSRYIVATTYTIEEFWNLCASSGLKVLYVTDLNPKVKYVTFSLVKM